jgi:hypothetical protein
VNCLNAGIAATAEQFNLLGKGTQTPVSAATNINKDIPMTTQNKRGRLTVQHGD